MLEGGETMGRCYDMSDGLLQLEDAMSVNTAEQPAVLQHELPAECLLPRLLAISESHEDGRLNGRFFGCFIAR